MGGVLQRIEMAAICRFEKKFVEYCSAALGATLKLPTCDQDALAGLR
jgi:hypothetical protein